MNDVDPKFMLCPHGVLIQNGVYIGCCSICNPPPPRHGKECPYCNEPMIDGACPTCGYKEN